MHKLCGKCAQSMKLPLEERKEIAISVKKNVKYQCPECEDVFRWTGKGYDHMLNAPWNV